MRIPQLVQLEAAVRMYYERSELSISDIITLFGCGRSKATQLKRCGKELMVKEDVPSWNALYVNTRVAYRAWGLDIADLEQRLSRLRRLDAKRIPASMVGG